MTRLFYISIFFLILVSLDTYLSSDVLAQQEQNESTIKAGYHYIAYSFLGIILLGCLFLIWDMFRRPSLAQGNMLPIGLEAITVILIVASVVILALTNTITSEGTVGILGSIVGYVLGKQTSRKKRKDIEEDS